MSDSWENEKGLNPGDPEDRNTVASSGYTMLEEYYEQPRKPLII